MKRLSIDQATPGCIKRGKNTDGAPTPDAFAKGFETAVWYGPPQHSGTTHVSNRALVSAVAAHVGRDDTTIERKWESLGLGYPLPSATEKAVDELCNLRGRTWHTGAHVTDGVKAILDAPTTKSPSNYKTKTDALATAGMQACQGMWCDGGKKEPGGLWHFCVACAKRYRFRIPATGSKRLFAVKPLLKTLARERPAEVALLEKIRAVGAMTREAGIGYLALTKAESRTFPIKGTQSLEELEYIGWRLLQQVYAFAYPQTWSAQRLLDMYSPQLALAGRYRPPRAFKTAWKTALERGFVARVDGKIKPSVWVMPAERAAAGSPTFIYSKRFTYCAAMVKLLAAVRGLHRDVEVRLQVTLVAGNGPPTTAVAPVKGGSVVIENAQHQSFVSVWLAVQRACDARAARESATTGRLVVVVELRGNPFAPPPPEPTFPAWCAVKAAAPNNGTLIRRPSTALLRWAIRAVPDKVALDETFTAAALYPATQTDVAAVADSVASGRWSCVTGYCPADAEWTARTFAADEGPGIVDAEDADAEGGVHRVIGDGL